MEDTSGRSAAETPRTVVLIPARGGSKSIPRKNLAMVGGCSLLTRAIRTAQAANVGEVCVSTEDGWISSQAISCGVSVIDRPQRLAQDDSQAVDVYRHARDVLKLSRQDIMVVMQCTSPMTTPSDVQKALQYLAAGYELVQTVVPFHGLVFSSIGQCLTWKPGTSTNRQEREQLWQLNGGAAAFEVNYLDRAWGSGLIGLAPADYPHCLDIDSVEDLERARMVISGEQSQRSGRYRGTLCEVVGSDDGYR